MNCTRCCQIYRFVPSKRQVPFLYLAFMLWVSMLCAPYVQATGTPALTGNINHLKYQPIKPNAAQKRTSLSVLDHLNYGHYQRLSIDDSLSSVMFDHYFKDLDSQKSYFLKSDLEEFEKYRHKFDEFIKSGELDPGFEIFNRFQMRAIERLTFVINLLEKKYEHLKFDTTQTLSLDEKTAEWAKTSTELDVLWQKRITNVVLNLRITNKEPEKIQALLVKRYRSRLNRLLQNNEEDAFQAYINSLTQSFDPHTQYLSPRTSENFNINMSLSLEGIGAVLQTEEEYTEVVRLVPAGPAEKSKQLYPADRVIGVGQGVDGEIVDVIGWRIDEVVDLIRGPKGTIVRLDVIPRDAGGDQKTKIVSIVRDKVKLEEQAAKKHLLEIHKDGKIHKVGVISLPTFYVDFQGLQNRDPEYKSSTRDTQRLIEKLKAEGIEGLVVDLRDNGGGYLQEASSLLGLFIRTGPTVQVKDDKGRVEILRDSDPNLYYSGPLVVLVNRLSASASEIFAGAIQDYQRGLVLGAQTFGKGTVQALKTLTHGQLKITQAKFYRVSGESNQHLGIVPDIEFPSVIDKEDIGESALDHALAWDKIAPVQYQLFSRIKPVIPEIKQAHAVRTASSMEFAYLKDYIRFVDRVSKETTVSLNETVRRDEKKRQEKEKLELENKKRAALNEPLLTKLDDDSDADTDEVKPIEPPSSDEFKKDFLLRESANVLLDYIKFSEGQTAAR